MRIWVVFTKSVIETIRDWKLLLMALGLAPLFVVGLYFFFGDGSQTFKVIVVNQDRPVSLTGALDIKAGLDLLGQMESRQYASGVPVFEVHTSDSIEASRQSLQQGAACLLVILPPDFSESLALPTVPAGSKRTEVIVSGDVSSYRYIIAAAFFDEIIKEYVSQKTGYPMPVAISEQPLGSTGSRTDFELYVPGLLVFAMVMAMFTAAIAVIKEVENGTIRRLQLSLLRPWEFLAAISLTQAIIAVLSLFLTLLTALALGFRLGGSMADVVVIGAFSSISIIAIALITAAFCRNSSDVLTLGNFPFFLIIFLTGIMFPVPDMQLFTLAGHSFNANGLIPPTHTIVALNKVLNYGAGLGDCWFELACLFFLTVIYAGVGLWLFNRRHMRLA